jgi:hypothetical protein
MATPTKKTRAQKTNKKAVKSLLNPEMLYEIEKRAYEIWLSNGGDGEMLQWVQSQSKTPRAPWEIEAWSSFMERRGPDSDAETIAGFGEYVGQHTKEREDIKTWFEAIELDDYVTFGGKA